MTKELNKIDVLDSLRGISILMVLAVHFTSLFKINNLWFNFEKILNFGRYGVILFFIVSGYSLFRSLDLRGEINYKNYAIRRFFRIVPMYFIVLTVLAIAFEFILKQYNDDILKNYLLHIFFINYFFDFSVNSIIQVEWTIFVEVCFYILLPIIFIYKRKLNLIFLFSLLVSLIFTYLYFNILDYEEFNRMFMFSPIPWMYIFVGGGSLYMMEKQIINTKLLQTNFLLKYLALFIIGLFVIFIDTLGYERFFASIILFLLFILSLHKPIKLVNNFILQQIGKISFSVYLIHMPIIVFVIKIFGTTFLSFIISLFLILTISAFTYRYIEIYFINIGKKLTIKSNK